jgi:hypothetical protein
MQKYRNLIKTPFTSLREVSLTSRETEMIGEGIEPEGTRHPPISA